MAYRSISKSDRSVQSGKISAGVLILALAGSQLLPAAWAIEESSVVRHQTLRGPQKEGEAVELLKEQFRAGLEESPTTIRLAPLSPKEREIFKEVLAFNAVETAPVQKMEKISPFYISVSPGIMFSWMPVLVEDGGSGGGSRLLATIAPGRWSTQTVQAIPNFPSALPVNGEWTAESYRIQIEGEKEVVPVQFRNRDGVLEIRTTEPGPPDRLRTIAPLLVTLVSRLTTVIPAPPPPQQFFRDSIVAIFGPTGDVGRGVVSDVLSRTGDVIQETRLVVRRDPERIFPLVTGLPGKEKVVPVIGNLLNPSQIREAIQGAKVVFNLAGLAWQHPLATPSESQIPGPERQFADNAASLAILGLSLKPGQRLVTASTSAVNYLQSRLNHEPKQAQALQAEVQARAGRTLDAIQKMLKEGTFSEDSLRRFIHQDLQGSAGAFVQGFGDHPDEPVTYATEYSYPYFKWVGEEILKRIVARGGAEIRIVRISDIYGPGQSMGEDILNGTIPGRRIQVFTAAYLSLLKGQTGWIAAGEKGTHGFRRVGDQIEQVVRNDWIAPTPRAVAVEALFNAALLPPTDRVVFKAIPPWRRNVEVARIIRDVVGVSSVKIVTHQSEAPEPTRNEEDLELLGIGSLPPFEEGVREFIRSARPSGLEERGQGTQVVPERIPALPVLDEAGGVDAESFIERQKAPLAILKPGALALIEALQRDGKHVQRQIPFIAIVQDDKQAAIVRKRIQQLGIHPEVGQVINLKRLEKPSAESTVAHLRQEFDQNWEIYVFSTYTERALWEVARILGVPEPDTFVRTKAELIQKVLSEYP